MKKKLLVRAASGSSRILVGESIENLRRYVDARRTVIITDSTVEKLYREKFPAYPVISIGLGEKIKTLETVTHLFSRLVDLEADRSTFLLGVGGGIVCDIAGFVASTYMRGTRFGFVSTTLLAQVDASVGGKNGVNFGGYKNMVGVFNQPDFVICDMALLKSLPIRELLCGFAEIIKHTVPSPIRPCWIFSKTTGMPPWIWMRRSSPIWCTDRWRSRPAWSLAMSGSMGSGAS